MSEKSNDFGLGFLVSMWIWVLVFIFVAAIDSCVEQDQCAERGFVKLGSKWVECGTPKTPEELALESKQRKEQP